MKRHRIHKIVAALKKKFPPAFPVYVRLVPLKDDMGCADLLGDGDNRYYVIKINKNVSFHHQCETLAHEFAHILNWSHLHDANPEDHGHDSGWGVWYAKLYTFVFIEMDENVV